MKQWLVRNFDFLLLVIVCIPLFTVNINSYHDWGGDFSQYIGHAKNIAEGKPYIETGYVYNPNYPIIAPEAYPIGYPLLLSPVYVLFGNNMLAFKYFNTLLLFLIAIISYCYFKSRFNRFVAFSLVILFCYNPWMLKFKGEIISDLAYTLFFILFLVAVEKLADYRNYKWGLIAGILGGMAMLIKSISIILPVALLIWLVLKWLKTRETTLFKPVFTTLVTFSLVFVLANLLIKQGFNHESHYVGFFGLQGIKDVLLKTSKYYIELFQNFFHPNVNGWDFFPLIIKAAALTFVVLGFFNRILFNIGFKEIVLISYTAIIFSFSLTTQGLRYLLPVLPILLIYMMEGLQSYKFNLGSIGKRVCGMALIIMVLFSYKYEWNQIKQNENNMIAGPQEQSSVELFDFIKTSIPKTDTLLFIKPRVIALYSDRFCISNRPEQDEQSFESDIKKMSLQYFIITTDLNNPTLHQYIEKHNNELEIIYQNEKFTVYKRF